MVIIWRIWADISHMGGMWVLFGFLLPILDKYGSSMGGTMSPHPYGTEVGLMWARVIKIPMVR